MHTPVLLEEAMHWLNVRTGHVYVDATAGAGGHLRGINYGERLRVAML